MQYTVTSSERTRPAGSSFETKALLYLASFHPNSNEIEFFVIDFFNDVTGTTRLDDKAWDLQSKSTDRQSPNAIGHNLVTLYKNYLSDFEFNQYILFIKGISQRVRIDNQLNSFDVSNIVPAALEKIIDGLIEECKTKVYIDNSKVSRQSVELFLEKVLFVIDDKDEIDYIRPLINVNPDIMPDEYKLKKIFDEICAAQSNKKDRKSVEGAVLNNFSEHRKYQRHIGVDQIRRLVLHRILDYDFSSSSSVPNSFTPYLDTLDKYDRKDLTDECHGRIARTLFDNSNAKNFWILLESICLVIIKNPNFSIDQIYDSIDKSIIKNNPHLDPISTKYFVSIVKDGLRVY